MLLLLHIGAANLHRHSILCSKPRPGSWLVSTRLWLSFPIEMRGFQDFCHIINNFIQRSHIFTSNKAIQPRRQHVVDPTYKQPGTVRQKYEWLLVTSLLSKYFLYVANYLPTAAQRRRRKKMHPCLGNNFIKYMDISICPRDTYFLHIKF